MIHVMLVVFSNRKVNKDKFNLTIEGHVLTLEDEYKYLGIFFSFNGRFRKAISRLKNKLKKHLPVDLQFFITQC